MVPHSPFKRMRSHLFFYFPPLYPISVNKQRAWTGVSLVVLTNMKVAEVGTILVITFNIQPVPVMTDPEREVTNMSTETLSWLNKDLFQEVLQQSEQDLTITVTDVSAELAVGKGENYTSVLHRVRVTFKRDTSFDQESLSLIIKTLSDNKVMRMFYMNSHAYEKEDHFYKVLLPKIQRLIREKLDMERVQMLTARYYPTKRPEIIILEDLSKLGFRVADRRRGMDLNHCTLALQALARFHALTTVLVAEEPGMVENYPESYFSEDHRAINNMYLPRTYESLSDIVGGWPGFERFADKIRGKSDHIIGTLNKLVKPKEGAFNVLNHGDFWVNNMMFRYDEVTEEVKDIRLIDFQIIRYGSPALDLQCFLTTSPNDEVRETKVDQLLEEYHSALTDNLRLLGMSPDLYSLETLKKEFNDCSLFGLNNAVVVFCAVVADPSDRIDVDSLTEEMMKSGEQSNHLGKAFNGERFRNSFQKLLLYMEKRGIL
uniref:CHK kinase-like domain-containing protein n=1 Tax=Timema monikensis TaxID=170555 RepID=A0A7R9E3A7_9NEOP|nr:unnamed protein product [Timema monikensis]